MQRRAARAPNCGSKGASNAMRKRKAEGFERPWQAMIEMDRQDRFILEVTSG